MKYTNPRPTTPLVTYDQMKAQLRIDGDDERGYILDLVDAAAEHAETALDASLFTRTIAATFWTPAVLNLWTARSQNRFYLPRGPVQAVTSITDAKGSHPAYELQREGATDYVVVTGSFVSPLTIQYTAGYGAAAADVPADIRMGIRTHVASLWRNRESVADRQLIPVPHSLADFYALKRRTPPVA